MSDKEQIHIYLTKAVMYKIDEQILKNKHSEEKGRDRGERNRSEFIENALHYYLKVKCGIPYMINLWKEKNEKV